MTEATLLPDNTPISVIVQVPRALAHLKKEGLETLGDVRGAGMEKVSKVQYVGPSTIVLLQEQMGEPTVEAEEPDVAEGASHVEGPHPLILHSPHHSLRISWSPARKITHPDGSYQVQDTIFLEFEAGQCEVTRRVYLLRKYKRDEQLVEQALTDEEPWRLECAALIRRMSKFNLDFFLMDD